MYSPLESGQIRLLRIHPGNPNEDIRASLVTTNLLEGPPFEALSYVWGDLREHKCLWLNEQAVVITTGLFDAIHTLRSSTSERLIWVDAVCINQTDESEKAHQVGIMDQIYGTAINVTVYLGRPNKTSEKGMQFLQLFMDMNVKAED